MAFVRPGLVNLEIGKPKTEEQVVDEVTDELDGLPPMPKE